MNPNKSKMRRPFKAIQIFFDFERDFGREPTLEEFNAIWQGAQKHYYHVRKQWREYKEGLEADKQ